jgi:hypothetical protein
MLGTLACRKSDPVVGRYRTNRRPNGTWTLELHASGHCRSVLDNGDSQRFVGTFMTNAAGDQIEIYDEPDFALAKLARVLHGQTNLHKSTLFLLRTNGTTFLLSKEAHRKYVKTGDPGTLDDQFKEIR